MGNGRTIHVMTVAALAAIAVSMNITFHEGVHALTCLSLGGRVEEFSALYIDGSAGSALGDRIVAGSASVANIIAGFLLLFWLRHSQGSSHWLRFFLWLLMLMSWLWGTGYLMFSGAAGAGDWADVIAGWEPAWFLRVLMFCVGGALFMLSIRASLSEFGRIVGGSSDEQIGRANRLALVSYCSAFVTVALAGLFNPYGLGSLPVVAGLAGVLGALSPLLWMMQLFRARRFVKLEGPPLEIHRNLGVILLASAEVFAFAFVLGRTIYL